MLEESLVTTICRLNPLPLPTRPPWPSSLRRCPVSKPCCTTARQECWRREFEHRRNKSSRNFSREELKRTYWHAFLRRMHNYELIWCTHSCPINTLSKEFALRLVDLIGPAAAHVRLPARESQGRMGHESVFNKNRLDTFWSYLLLRVHSLYSFPSELTCTFRKDRTVMSFVAVSLSRCRRNFQVEFSILDSVPDERLDWKSLHDSGVKTVNPLMTVEWKVSVVTPWKRLWLHIIYIDI